MNTAELLAFIKKNPISVGCGLLCLILGAGIYFRSSEIPDAEAALAQKSAEAARYAANIKNAAQLKEQLDVLVAASKEIDSRIVHAGQLGVNSQYFYKLENESGAKLIDFRQGSLVAAPKGTKPSFNPVGFTVSVQGNLSQMIEFLHRLESGAHFCRVTSATCGTTGTGRSGLLTLTITLELLGLP